MAPPRTVDYDVETDELAMLQTIEGGAGGDDDGPGAGGDSGAEEEEVAEGAAAARRRQVRCWGPGLAGGAGRGAQA